MRNVDAEAIFAIHSNFEILEEDKDYQKYKSQIRKLWRKAKEKNYSHGPYQYCSIKEGVSLMNEFFSLFLKKEQDHFQKALQKNNTITWKQSTDIKIDDIVYIYVGQPYSSIMYKFKVMEVNIPYEYKDKNLKMQKIMKIELIKRYEKGKLSFGKLKEFGVNAIRSQRYMPLDLSKYINKIEKEAVW